MDSASEFGTDNLDYLTGTQNQMVCFRSSNTEIVLDSTLSPSLMDDDDTEITFRFDVWFLLPVEELSPEFQLLLP